MTHFSLIAMSLAMFGGGTMAGMFLATVFSGKEWDNLILRQQKSILESRLLQARMELEDVLEER